MESEEREAPTSLVRSAKTCASENVQIETNVHHLTTVFLVLNNFNSWFGNLKRSLQVSTESASMLFRGVWGTGGRDESYPICQSVLTGNENEA